MGFSSDYAHGVTMLSPFTSEKKQLVSFCSPSGEELRKFAEELREAIAEVNEMEQIHIQCKGGRTHIHTSQFVQMQTHTCGVCWSGFNLSFWCHRGIREAARHPATWHTQQWRASGHTHRTRLSLRCWFCSHSIKCTTLHTLLITVHIGLRGMLKNGGMEKNDFLA